MSHKEIQTGNRDAAFGEMRGSKPHHAVSYNGQVLHLFGEELENQARHTAKQLHNKDGQRRSVSFIEVGKEYTAYINTSKVHGINDGYRHET